MTSRGYLTDLIQSIGEYIALTSHIEEKLSSTSGEERTHLEQILANTLTLRRKKMERLLDSAEKPNPLYWCSVKHTLGASTRDWEVYEATGDKKDLEIAIESTNILAMTLSQFLGMEFEECATCLYDKMLVQQLEKAKNATMEITKGENANE